MTLLRFSLTGIQPHIAIYCLPKFLLIQVQRDGHEFNGNKEEIRTLMQTIVAELL